MNGIKHCETIELPTTDDSTDMMKELGKSFERSLAGFVTEFQSASLSSARCGRAQRLQPAHVMPSAPTCRASRPGEAHLVADTVGKAVLVWFKQLRRLQSFRHAACAGQQHEAAVQYRIELWSSIRRAKGFDPTFCGMVAEARFCSCLGDLFPSLLRLLLLRCSSTRLFTMRFVNLKDGTCNSDRRSFRPRMTRR